MIKSMNIAVLAFAATALFGFTYAQVGSKDLFRCRQSCYQKFIQDWHHCMDFEDCKNMCITPPNINSYIPEAFSFLCWNNCDQQLGPFPLNINSAIRQGSLVLTDIAWDQAITNASKQCLVTWEVSGGGLMGNLLTDSSTVELSLWPETVYHVQVTCKHKETGGMRRSYKLIVDTHKLSDSTATGMQAIELATNIGKSLPNIYANDHGSNSAETETDSRMRILKDSSKDFLTPYNPDANAPVQPAKDTKSTSSYPKSSNTNSKSTSHAPQENSILRSKLNTATIGMGQPSVDFLDQSILFAIVGSIILFFGLLTLYALTRPVRKEVPLVSTAIDKEVLINSEMLPSQTPAARASSAQMHDTMPAPDSRTLHV